MRCTIGVAALLATFVFVGILAATSIYNIIKTRIIVNVREFKKILNQNYVSVCRLNFEIGLNSSRTYQHEKDSG